MFENISSSIHDLQKAYESKEREKIKQTHSKLIQLGLELIIQSDFKFNQNGDLTAEWSDVGTEGASAIVKAIELANRYDSQEDIITNIERTYLLNLAAIEYFRCGRHGITAAIFKREDSKLPNEYQKSPTSIIAQLLQLFCKSEFTATWGACNDYKYWIKGQINNKHPLNQNQGPTYTNVQLLLSVTCFCEALFMIKNHLIDGNMEHFNLCRSWVERAIYLNKNSGDIEYTLFLESFARIVNTLQKLSIWNIGTCFWTPGHLPELFNRWANHRISKKKPFLFPTQYEALISNSCLTRDVELVGMPTGGGKSLLAEIFILKEFIRKPNNKIFYIVPSRALASEKRDELLESFGWRNTTLKVCQMTGDVAFDVEDALEQNNVFIVTPEKFDILLRLNFFDHSIGGLVVDEFHTLKTSYRGIKLQLEIKRFQKNYQTPIIFISAIVRTNDFSALARWVYSSQPFSTNWKPTPARIGLVSLDNRPSTEVSFNDGTFRDVEIGSIRRNSHSKAGIRVVEEFLLEDQVLHFNLSWRGHKQGENRLLDLANEYIKTIPNIPVDNPDSLRYLSKKMSRLIGNEHPLTKAFEKGVAVHWGELPHIARKIVEEGVRTRAIKLILSTSTLAQGVNLPIKTIFVPKLSTRYKGEMEIGLFLNVIGRAGRPFFHSEGQIVIGHYNVGRRDDRNPKPRAEKYARATTDDIEPLVTAISITAELFIEAIQLGVWEKENVKPMQNWEQKLEENQKKKIAILLAEVEGLSSNLLACIEERLISKIDCKDIENLIFLGTETTEQREQIKDLLRMIEKRLISFNAVKKEGELLIITNWGKTIYKTGFGPGTCTMLKEHIDGFIEKYSQFKVDGSDIRNNNSISYSYFNYMLESLNIPYERYKIGDGTFDSTDFWLLRGWVSGVQTETIAKGNRRLKGDYLRAFTRIDGLISTYSAWTFYTNYLIAKFTYGERSEVNSMSSLAKYALYGHYNPEILKLLEKDVNRELLRDDVILLYDLLGSFMKLQRREYNADQIEEILKRSQKRTRVTEKEIAKVVEKIFSRA